VWVPSPDVLGSTAFPAPSVQVWGGVSKVLVAGIDGLPESARIAALVGALIGVALVLCERFAPKGLQKYVPSPSGIGIAMVIPGSNAIAMALGATIAELLRRSKPDLAERTVTPVASGFIAGESLMGIVVAVLVALGLLNR
jgi:uncharacterized oligopeptide transporter (OPT) family protein